MRTPSDLTDSELLVDVVRSFAADERWRRRISLETADAVLRKAATAALLPIVLHEFRASGVPVPDWASAALTQLSMRKLAQRADLNRAAECLDAVGVRWLILKGPVLDEDVYRVPGLRTYGDIDILIHPDDFERGWRALQEDGARDLDLNWERLAMTGQSEITLQLRAGTILDLHWHVISNRRTRASFGLDSRTLFERTRTVTVWGRRLRTLDEAATLQYVCLHAALAGAHELRWMLDIHEAALRAPSPEVVLREFGLVTAVMVDRAAASLPLPTTWPKPRWSAWRLACRSARRLVPVGTGERDRYSGQALFRATRSSTRTSFMALGRSARDTWRRGPSRRLAGLDQAELRRAAGTELDLATWLGTIRETSRRPVSGRTR